MVAVKFRVPAPLVNNGLVIMVVEVIIIIVVKVCLGLPPKLLWEVIEFVARGTGWRGRGYAGDVLVSLLEV